MINANNPALTSWIIIPENSDFPIQNLPFGIATLLNLHKQGDMERRHFGVTIIGEQVISLAALQQNGYFSGIKLPAGVFEKEYLNDFIALGKPVCRAVRERLSELFRKDNSELRDNAEARKK